MLTPLSKVFLNDVPTTTNAFYQLLLLLSRRHRRCILRPKPGKNHQACSMGNDPIKRLVGAEPDHSKC